MTGRTSNIKQVPSKCIDPFLLTYHQPFNTLHLHAKVDLVLKRVTAIPVNQADVKKKQKKFNQVMFRRVDVPLRGVAHA
jgi:hypothetical protein